MPSEPLYLLLLLPVALFLAVGLVRIRAQAVLSAAERKVDVRVGGIGVEIDLRLWRARVRVLGWWLYSFRLDRGRLPKTAASRRKERPLESRRRRSIPDLVETLAASTDGLLRFVAGVIAATARERLEARVEGGLGEPHFTGIALGYYHAAAGLVPALSRRLSVAPEWQGDEVKGSLRLWLAVPVYRVEWLAALLLVRLPLRKWARVRKGKVRA